tara:strand:- start:1770 stop:2084 length:315 start_codon:yes stop_codon:yes gene_type:complete
MLKSKLKLIVILLILPTITYCGSAKDALVGKKRSEQSDEFLVKKKNPLQMPPEMNKLPKPGDDVETQNQIKNNEIQEILKVGENNNDSSSNESDLLKNMKKKIQ